MLEGCRNPASKQTMHLGCFWNPTYCIIVVSSGEWGIVYDCPELSVGRDVTSNLHPTADLSLVFERLHTPLESYLQSKQDVISVFTVDHFRNNHGSKLSARRLPRPTSSRQTRSSRKVRFRVECLLIRWEYFANECKWFNPTLPGFVLCKKHHLVHGT